MRICMKNKFYLLLAFCCLTTGMMAETREDRANWRNEVRIGWGDQLFESLMWHNPTYTITTMPATYEITKNENYRYHQHIWLEYQYRFNNWFSLGAMADVSEVGWDVVLRNGAGTELSREKKHFFYNLVIMPTVRFTYFHHPYVNIYSGVGAGIGINGGTEKNSAGKNTDYGMALNFTVVGISANYKRWFMAFDYGGMYSLKNANCIFLAKSRMFNLSVGARF